MTIKHTVHKFQIYSCTIVIIIASVAQWKYFAKVLKTIYKKEIRKKSINFFLYELHARTGQSFFSNYGENVRPVRAKKKGRKNRRI